MFTIKNMKVVPKKNERILQKSWKTKICECCDDDWSMFIYGVICAGTSIPQLFEKTVVKGYCLVSTLIIWTSFTLVLTIPIYLTDNLNYFGLIWGISSCIVFSITTVVMVYRTRSNIRIKSNIKGNNLDDFCTSLWCCCCSHMQHMREEDINSENYKLNSINAV